MGAHRLALQERTRPDLDLACACIESIPCLPKMELGNSQIGIVCGSMLCSRLLALVARLDLDLAVDSGAACAESPKPPCSPQHACRVFVGVLFSRFWATPYVSFFASSVLRL